EQVREDVVAKDLVSAGDVGVTELLAGDPQSDRPSALPTPFLWHEKSQQTAGAEQPEGVARIVAARGASQIAVEQLLSGQPPHRVAEILQCHVVDHRRAPLLKSGFLLAANAARPSSTSPLCRRSAGARCSSRSAVVSGCSRPSSMACLNSRRALGLRSASSPASSAARSASWSPGTTSLTSPMCRHSAAGSRAAVNARYLARVGPMTRAR